ncbi:succinate dehydrogenase, cytochrome b556 subunit [Oricola cellulosilytica]|uniref:Succinate dehydrogenase cytochrome b556 subunit n=1 Tax=Oricola cellulosilytica TaxID=1429082 RepID=A0A4R0PFQ2_9HYPH|nr:succinate dehydrogenase, cytochrome b556 subunit [Oricola cellulosilytica]TCD15918.1 succinate dehydrogenase, cytochrome b556 subunit [Oricola cellulosilytica]
MSASQSASGSSRPLSPHLQIYKPIITMTMSIAHRLTGIALYFGTVLVAWWLIAAASGAEYFAFVNGFFGSWFGILVMFGYTWALIHHMLGGLRHFAWDFGYLIEKHTATRLAYATIIGSVSLTIAIWIVGAIAK